MSELQAIIHNASEVVTIEEGGLTCYENGAVAIIDEKVGSIGDTDKVTRKHPPENATTSIDATGKTVLPGFVDPHTHAVFAGDRSDEFAAKLSGKTYRAILDEGGGILRTVRAVREASDKLLLSNLLKHLDVMLAHGTTTVEVKSGYGLDKETELQLLDVIDRANEEHPIDLVPAFMRGHAISEGVTADEYVSHVVEVDFTTCLRNYRYFPTRYSLPVGVSIDTVDSLL